MIEVAAAILPDDEAAAIDPFAFVPVWTSRVSGLGGPEIPPDPGYVFHTAYGEFGEGDVMVTLAFEGLAATRGSLVLRVNAFPARPGAVAYQVICTEVPLRLVQIDGGRTYVRFTPLPDTFYAVLGHIYDETDAVAEGLELVVQRAAAIEAQIEARTSARRTAFGAPTIRASAKLTAIEPPRLAEPVSQLSTAAQYDEPVYAEWVARTKAAGRRDAAEWQSVYILQALRRYGMLEPGARGLGFGADTGALPAIMAASGCRIELADPAAGAGRSRRPDIVEDAVFDGHVLLQPIDRAQPLPPTLTGFDFLWSGAANADLGGEAAVADFVHRSLDCLKPGGVAVHVFATEVTPGGDGIEEEGATVLRRVTFDRLALTLIGYSHEVAQLNYLGEVAPGPLRFGMILRRSLRA